MQEDAIRRVREMQRQSKLAIEENNRESNTESGKESNRETNREASEEKRGNSHRNNRENNHENNHGNNQNNNAQSITREGHTEKTPDNRSEHKHVASTHEPAAFNNTRRKNGSFIDKNKIQNMLQNDEFSEQILLLAILILLMNEKSDTILLLAIIYILSD